MSIKIDLVSRYTVIVFLIFIVFLTPWESLKGVSFEDLQNYIDRMVQLDVYGESYIIDSGSYLANFAKEIGWGYLLLLLTFAFDDYRLALFCVSLFCCCVIASYVLRKTNHFVASILLINPIFVDLLLSQQRSALAFSIFLISLAYRNTLIIFLLFLLALSVHLASLILFAFLVIVNLLNNVPFQRREVLKRNVLSFVAVLVLSLSMYILKDIFLGYIGDRRVGDGADSVSIAYSLFWYASLVCLVFFSSRTDRDSMLAIFFLGVFTVASLLGEYSARYLSFSLPFVIVALPKLTQGVREFWLVVFLLYAFIQWIYWLRLFF